VIPGFFFAQLLWDFWYNGIALTRKQVINFLTKIDDKL